MKRIKFFISGLFFILFTGCSAFNMINFDGIYKINGKKYKSIDYFNEGLFINNSFCKEMNLYGEESITKNKEDCKKINHPNFDLYLINRPKYEEWEWVTACSEDDYDNLISYYTNSKNNNFFVGKLQNESNYLSSCVSFYQVPDNTIPAGNSYFEELIEFCKNYEAQILSSNSKIKKEAKKFDAATIKNHFFVKLFRISKDGYFYSNKKESFICIDGVMYLFCLEEGGNSDVYYCMPLPSHLNSFFLPIVNNCLASNPISMNNYSSGYFYDSN